VTCNTSVKWTTSLCLQARNPITDISDARTTFAPEREDPVPLIASDIVFLLNPLPSQAFASCTGSIYGLLCPRLCDKKQKCVMSLDRRLKQAIELRLICVSCAAAAGITDSYYHCYGSPPSVPVSVSDLFSSDLAAELLHQTSQSLNSFTEPIKRKRSERSNVSRAFIIIINANSASLK
jgi:hypothetical protein